jgi:F1F0 ATPase subunit 2
MNDAISLIGSCIAGILLGGIFFCGLWWATRKGIASKQPAIWFVGSLLCRTSLILAGIYWIGNGDWQRILACMLGIVAIRIAVIRLSRFHRQQPKLNCSNGEIRES